MYGPTNINTYGQYLNNISATYTCGTNYVNLMSTYYPKYFPQNMNDAGSIINTFPVNCPVSATDIATFANNCNTGYPEYCNVNYQILITYNFLESALGFTTTTPGTNATMSAYSPCNNLTSTRIIPTFIMHGKSDLLTPYANCTSTMDTHMANPNGGLIGTYDGTTIPASSTYGQNPLKHMIKKYNFANHGWTDASGSNSSSTAITLREIQVRPDIITWLNGH
ncbi:MAG: hypothetical protein JWN78_1353 [Bacteroidota bacterium]|nr:hypothetical protein [Bacteroidota bacterium]